MFHTMWRVNLWYVNRSGCMRNDHEQCWIREYREVEVVAIENSRDLYPLIGNIGPRKSNISEVIKVSDGTLIRSRERHLQSSVEPFRGRFSWLIVTVDLPLMPVNEPMQVHTNPPFENKVIKEKRYEIAGPVGLSSSFFEDGHSVNMQVNKTLGINKINRTQPWGLVWISDYIDLQETW